MTTNVAIVVYEGFDELDAIGPYEVFDAAASAGADFSVSLCTLEPTDTVVASHGLTIEPHDVLAVEPADPGVHPDVVVVPGGGWNDRSEVGARREVERGALPDAAARLAEAGVTIAAVCTGSMLLAAAGLVDGRPATTHAGALDDLRETDAEVVDARVVDDGDVVTAGGVTSGLDLALWMVEREPTAAVADAVATEIEYERRGDVYRSDG